MLEGGEMGTFLPPSTAAPFGVGGDLDLHMCTPQGPGPQVYLVVLSDLLMNYPSPSPWSPRLKEESVVVPRFSTSAALAGHFNSVSWSSSKIT